MTVDPSETVARWKSPEKDSERFMSATFLVPRFECVWLWQWTAEPPGNPIISTFQHSLIILKVGVGVCAVVSAGITQIFTISFQ